MQTICKGLGALGIVCTVEQPSIEVVRDNFMKHISEWGHSYGTQEEFEFRFQIYHENDKIINEINGDPENTFLVGHNMFSTMTKDEFKRWKGKKPKLDDAGEPEILDTSVMAGSVDWRTKGAVNKV